MQLEETASSKDVPPLSTRGDFELPEFVAQNNMLLEGIALLVKRMAYSHKVCKRNRSLVC